MSRRRFWLWPANAAGTLVVATAAILQPVAVLSAPCDAEVCDPHGYIAIFSTAPAVGVAAIALVALVLLISGKRAGFATALAAAGAGIAVLVMFAELVPASVVWPCGAAIVVVVGLALAGLRSAPSRMRPALEEPPYPPGETV